MTENGTLTTEQEGFELQQRQSVLAQRTADAAAARNGAFAALTDPDRASTYRAKLAMIEQQDEDLAAQTDNAKAQQQEAWEAGNNLIRLLAAERLRLEGETRLYHQLIQDEEQLLIQRQQQQALAEAASSMEDGNEPENGAAAGAPQLHLLDGPGATEPHDDDTPEASAPE